MFGPHPPSISCVVRSPLASASASPGRNAELSTNRELESMLSSTTA